MKVLEIIVSKWADSVSGALSVYTGSTEAELQSFLDSEIKWKEAGYRPTALEVIDAEASYLAKLEVASVRQEAINTINTLESQVTNRRMREAASDGAGGSAEGREWLANQNNLISAERVKL